MPERRKKRYHTLLFLLLLLLILSLPDLRVEFAPEVIHQEVRDPVLDLAQPAEPPRLVQAVVQPGSFEEVALVTAGADSAAAAAAPSVAAAAVAAAVAAAATAAAAAAGAAAAAAAAAVAAHVDFLPKLGSSLPTAKVHQSFSYSNFTIV